jgi:hypothetical protein
MNTMETIARLDGQTTLPGTGLRALSVQAVLLALAAAIMPAVFHLSGFPVRWILPMHWAVLLAGLTYGWRAGAAIGLLAPGASFLLSGMPLPHILPAMTAELGAYGLMAGYARQVWRLAGAASIALAIIAGRLIFVAMALATGAVTSTILGYLGAALLPGLLAAVAQVVTLPLIARWWITREAHK